MALEHILETIEREAAGASAAIIAGAEERAAAIRAEYAGRAETLRAELGARARTRAADEGKRLVVGEQLELRKALLDRKREILGEVYREASRRIESLPPAEYLELLRRLIVRRSISGQEEIIVPAAQRDLFGADFLEALNGARGGGAAFTISPEAGDFTWGVVLREGKRKVDLTLAVLFEQIRERLESAVAAALFPPE